MLLELKGEIEVFEVVVSSEVAILLVGAAFAAKVALVVDLPELCDVSVPAGDILAVEE